MGAAGWLVVVRAEERWFEVGGGWLPDKDWLPFDVQLVVSFVSEEAELLEESGGADSTRARLQLQNERRRK